MIFVDFLNDVPNKYPRHDAKLIKNENFSIKRLGTKIMNFIKASNRIRCWFEY